MSAEQWTVIKTRNQQANRQVTKGGERYLVDRFDAPYLADYLNALEAEAQRYRELADEVRRWIGQDEDLLSDEEWRASYPAIAQALEQRTGEGPSG